MKKILILLALSAAFATSAMAKDIHCATTPDQYGGSTSITLHELDPYDAVISGQVSGGMAHFIEKISATNVKADHEPDGTLYTNSEVGMSLSIFTTPIGGRLVTTASFQRADNYPSEQMTCK